jgi:ADP-ribose pyrophosphatase
MKKVEIIGRRRVFDDHFKIEEAKLQFERYDGQMSSIVRRLNFERGDSSAAIVVNRQRQTVYLTEQFRFPTLDKGDGWIVEVAAGSVDAGEGPIECIKREILEEMGFEVESVRLIADFFLSPGGSSERIFLFCAVVSDASRKSAGGGVATEDEDIKVVEWPVDEFVVGVQAGRFHDAKTIVAGYWLKENLRMVFAG